MSSRAKNDKRWLMWSVASHEGRMQTGPQSAGARYGVLHFKLQEAVEMTDLFEGTHDLTDMGFIYETMEKNCPVVFSESKSLWKLRCACNISDNNTSGETMIEKSVAILASKGHMKGWFNQCPAASGIGDSSRNRRRDVDLVHWNDSASQARMIELKMNSDDPHAALRQILRYGAAYLFCRIHKDKLPLDKNRLMQARHVSLEIIAPYEYYRDHEAYIERMRDSLSFVDSAIDGLSMSLSAFAFPRKFKMPFKNGREVKEKCRTPDLTKQGRFIRDMFENLIPV